MISDRDLVQPNELRAQASATLVRRLFADLQSLASQEAQFVRTECEQKSGAAVAAAQAAAFAYGIALVAIAVASFAIVEGLAPYLGLWPAATIVAGLLALAAAGCAQSARSSAAGLLPLRSATLVGTPKPNAASLDDQAMRIASTRKRVDDALAALERKGDILTPLRNTAVGMGALGVALASIVRHGNGSER